MWLFLEWFYPVLAPFWEYQIFWYMRSANEYLWTVSGPGAMLTPLHVSCNSYFSLCRRHWYPCQLTKEENTVWSLHHLVGAIDLSSSRVRIGLSMPAYKANAFNNLSTFCSLEKECYFLLFLVTVVWNASWGWALLPSVRHLVFYKWGCLYPEGWPVQGHVATQGARIDPLLPDTWFMAALLHDAGGLQAKETVGEQVHEVNFSLFC